MDEAAGTGRPSFDPGVPDRLPASRRTREEKPAKDRVLLL